MTAEVSGNAGAPDSAQAGALPEWFTRKRRRGNLIVSPIVPWIMVGIPVAILVAIVVYPTIWMAYHAFQDTNMMSLFSGEWHYVGWQNFANTLISTIASSPASGTWSAISCSAPACRSCSASRWR